MSAVSLSSGSGFYLYGGRAQDAAGSFAPGNRYFIRVLPATSFATGGRWQIGLNSVR